MQMNNINVNSILKNLEKRGYYRLLSMVVWVMYRIKGKKIRSVKFLKELNVWEFEIGNDFFYSSGPGWVYDYDYLLQEFSTHLGFHYLPKDGDCVIDVGAGVGEELMIFSKRVGDSGRVFAIEAHPKTFKALEYNRDRNKLKNTELLNFAIADAPGHIFIEDTQDSLGNKVSKEQNTNTFRVEAITIKQLVDRFEIDRVDFMKVNIEGAEQLLVKGIGSAIHKIRNVAISCHDFRYQNEGVEFFKTKKIILEFLRASDFECVIRNTGNPLLDDYVYAFQKNK
jgi:FkbM family methyltransferase